jgi:hypothetical protein
MINYNLAGKALIHCLKVAGSKFMLVDEDSELMGRIEGVRGEIESDVGSTICVLNAATKADIRAQKPERVGDEHRDGVQGNWPMCIFYTR